MNVMLYGFASSLAQVATPTFSPAPGSYNAYPNSTYPITLSDSNVSAHIFYTKDTTSPTHAGDSATGTTFRIGAHSGSVVLPASLGGHITDIKMLAYVNGLTDSNVATGEYDIDRDSGL